jgi:hypothetical protein
MGLTKERGGGGRGMCTLCVGKVKGNVHGGVPGGGGTGRGYRYVLGLEYGSGCGYGRSCTFALAGDPKDARSAHAQATSLRNSAQSWDTWRNGADTVIPHFSQAVPITST